MSTSPDNGSGGGSEKTKMEINQNFVDEARKGNLSCIELLLSDDGSGVDINHKSKGRSQSALNAASQNGHENVVKFLLSHNCDIHTKDSKGVTPLISATLSGHREVVRLLLEAGADADTPTNFPNQYTAITMAYSKGFSEILSLLINSERNKKESCHKFQNSLCYGIGKKYDDLIPLLVAAGANANTVFDDGSNLVTQAISSKNYSTLGVLLSCGATINDTTLNDADSEGQTLLIKCAETGADIAVDYLIKTGADIEKKDSKGMTALMKASEKGHVNVVSVLLQSGAQWKGIKNKDGYNANDLANKNKHEEASDLLKLFGFSKWGDQARFNHVLINAASRSHDGVCAKILDKGMFVDVTNEEGKTGLHSAAEAGHMSTVQLFLERGADSSLISKVGLSPMQYSLKFGHYQIAAKLLNAKSKTPGLLKSALSRINDFYEYLNHDCFDKDAFGNSEDQLYEKLPLYQIHSEELLSLEDKKCEEEEDSDIEDDVNRSEPSIIETIVKFGSEKDKKMCLEVLVLANEKKYGDTNPDRTEQKVIEKLRGIFHHPDLAFTVRYVKSLFPIGSVTFMLSSGILFITNIIVGFGNYCLDIGTDIHYTESLFSEDFDENSTVTVINSNETILAVPTSNGFFIAGVISAIHVGLSIFMSIVFFLSMECRQFSRESLHKIPLPFVTKTYGFYLEYQKLREGLTRKKKSIFALPTTLGLMRGAGKIDDFLTIQNFSILTSFLSFSWACVTIRNLDKKKTLESKSLVLLMLRILVDVISRLALISSCMFSMDGCFNSIFIVSCYYGIFCILIAFNIIFNKEKINCSLHYWIGLSINSLTSILTFNSFSFTYLSKEKKADRPPEGTLVKQVFYNIIFFTINLGLTIGTLLNISAWNKDVDNINGFSRLTFSNLITIGWVTFALSVVLNLGYYKVHPSGVDCTRENPDKKMTFYFFGSKTSFWKLKQSTEQVDGAHHEELQPLKQNNV